MDGFLCTTKSDSSFFIFKFRPVMLIYDPSEGTKTKIIIFLVAGGGPEKANPVMMAITSGPGVQKTLNFVLRATQFNSWERAIYLFARHGML